MLIRMAKGVAGFAVGVLAALAVIAVLATCVLIGALMEALA